VFPRIIDFYPMVRWSPDSSSQEFDESVCSGWSRGGEESVLRLTFGVDLVVVLV
jgi:hypothetical protein